MTIAIFLRSVAPIVIATVMAGCATITRGVSQTLSVNTDPEGAACELTRDGARIAVVDPTPGTARVGKSKNTIFVTCRKIGFEEAVDAIYTISPKIIYADAVMGGPIAFGIDAATGAMFEYWPETVLLVLAPEEFPSTAERDAFFRRETAAALQRANEKKTHLQAECKENCETVLKAVDDEMASKLAEIESTRVKARVLRSRK